MVYASSILPETVMSTRMGILLLGQNNELWIKGSWLLLVHGYFWFRATDGERLRVNGYFWFMVTFGSWFRVNG